jgi:hypothetical protein
MFDEAVNHVAKEGRGNVGPELALRHRGFDHVNDAMCTGLIERKAPGLSIRRIGPQLLEY